MRGAAINGVEGALITPDSLEGIAHGSVIYRNHDHAFLTQLAKSRPERVVALRLTLSDTREGLLLAAIEQDGNQAEARIACAPWRRRNRRPRWRISPRRC